MAPILAKSLSRLSRESLIKLCMQWSKSQHSTPYLASNRNVLECDEEDYLHEPVETQEELQEFYRNLRDQENRPEKDKLSKRDIIDRIVDGDWRRGLSLHQLALIDFAYLEQNNSALRWSALKLVHLSSQQAESTHPAKKRRKLAHPTAEELHYPQITPSAFLKSLHAQISPLVKAHYMIQRLASTSNLAVLRLYITPNTSFVPSKSSVPKSPRQATDSARIMYIALPDSCPYVYVSLSGTTTSQMTSDPKSSVNVKMDMTTIKKIILEAIPKALSKPQERWSLESTKLTSRSLRSISLLRGNGRPGTAGGAFSRFSEEYSCDSKHGEIRHTASEYTTQRPKVLTTETAPLRVQLPTPPPEEVSELQLQVHKRFGAMHGASHAAINRFHIKLTDVLAPAPYTIPRQEANKGKKRKRRSLEEIENGSQPSPRGKEPANTIRQDSGHNQATLSLTFSGTDVFAGLKQLALLGPEYVDLSKMPTWVTGEKGVSGLVI